MQSFSAAASGRVLPPSRSPPPPPVTFFSEAPEESGVILVFLVQPKVSANSNLELKIGDVDMRAMLCGFKMRNFDSLHRSPIREG